MCLPAAQPGYISQAHLLIAVICQLDGIRRARPGACAATLALGRVNIRCASQPANPASIWQFYHLWDLERAGADAVGSVCAIIGPERKAGFGTNVQGSMATLLLFPACQFDNLSVIRRS